MSFLEATRVRVISAVALVVASLVSIFGGMIFANESKYSNAFFGVIGVLYMPGLTVAAVVGGALGIGGIHDPNLVLAGILNFLLYGLGSFFVLKRIFKSKIQADSSARR
jgi:hypothetical protein